MGLSRCLWFKFSVLLYGFKPLFMFQVFCAMVLRRCLWFKFSLLLYGFKPLFMVQVFCAMVLSRFLCYEYTLGLRTLKSFVIKRFSSIYRHNRRERVFSKLTI